MKTKKMIDIMNICLYILVIMFFILVGFVFGVIYQQQSIYNGLSKILSYSNIQIDVNINETKLVQEMNKTIVPEMKNILNKTT